MKASHTTCTSHPLFSLFFFSLLLHSMYTLIREAFVQGLITFTQHPRLLACTQRRQARRIFLTPVFFCGAACPSSMTTSRRRNQWLITSPSFRASSPAISTPASLHTMSLHLRYKKLCTQQRRHIRVSYDLTLTHKPCAFLCNSHLSTRALKVYLNTFYLYNS